MHGMFKKKKMSDSSSSRNKKNHNGSISSYSALKNAASKYFNKDTSNESKNNEIDINDPNIPDTSRGDYFCKYCDSHMNDKNIWQIHIKGKRHLMNITNFDGDTLKTEVDEKPLILQKLNKITGIIVGLTSTCELRKANVNPSFYCYLCGGYFRNDDKFICHLLSLKHKLAYIKITDPKQHELINLLGIKKGALETIVNDHAGELETKYGRGKMQVKWAKEKKNIVLNTLKKRAYETELNGYGSEEKSYKSHWSDYSPQRKYRRSTYDENSSWEFIKSNKRKQHNSDTDSYESEPKFSKYDKNYDEKEQNKYRLKASLRPKYERNSEERVIESYSNNTLFEQKKDEEVVVSSHEKFLHATLLKIKSLAIKNRKEAELASQISSEIMKLIMKYALEISPPEQLELFKELYTKVDFNLMDKILNMLPQQTPDYNEDKLYSTNEGRAEIDNNYPASSFQTSLGLYCNRENETANPISQHPSLQLNYNYSQPPTSYYYMDTR